LRERAVRLTSSERLCDTLCAALILALVAVMLGRCLRGDYPIGHDHPVHLFRIWQFGQTLRHHPFSPWTWSHRWFAGYPQNVVYPIGADLFVLGVQALSLGTLSLGHAYGIGFFLFYFLFGLATYFFVSRALDSRVAALVAVLFLLTDPGSNDTGGWFFTVDLGVWAAPFGIAAMLIALVQISELFSRFDRRKVVIAAACIGAAFLCHPLHLIFVAMALPLLCVCRYITGAPTSWSRTALTLPLVVLLALFIASYWLVPYIAASPYALEIGGHGDDLKKIGSALSGAHFFDRMNPFAATFGFVGAISLLASRRQLALFMSIFAFACIFASSSTWIALLGPHAGAWITKHIITQRFLILAKPFWYGAAGFGITAVWRAVTLLGKRESPKANFPRQTAFVALVAVCVGPLAFYFLQSFVNWEVKRPTVWFSNRTDGKARREFIDWLRNTTSKDGPGTFFRIAHGFDWDDHDLADLAIQVPRPFYKTGPTPSGHFKYQVYSGSNATFRALNVRFALSHKPIPPRSDLQLVKIFDDKLWLYQFRDWNPVPFEVNGTGPVELITFREDEIVLGAGAGANGMLRLNVSDYPKWKATRDGESIQISAVPVPTVENSAMMQVPLSPGTLRFHYSNGVTDYVGTLLSIFGVASCITLVKSKRAARRLEFLESEDPQASHKQAAEQSKEQQ
jgi:hypothetical protein